MDKNTITGFVLIAAVLIGFSFFNRTSDEEKKLTEEQRKRQQTEYVEVQEEAYNHTDTSSRKTNVVDDFFAISEELEDESLTPKVSTIAEEIYTIENDKVKLNISTKGAKIVSAQLKEYSNYKEDSLEIINDETTSVSLFLTSKKGSVLNTETLNFVSIPTKDKSSLIMRFSYSEKQYVDFIYKLSESDYKVKFDVNLVGMTPFLNREKADVFEMLLTRKMARFENSKKNEQRYSGLFYRYVGDDVKELDANKDDSKEVKQPIKWFAFKNQFFASILIADKQIELALLDSKILESEDYLKDCKARIFTKAEVIQGQDILHAGFSYYFGPMKYSHLKAYDENVSDPKDQLDLDKLVPLGWALFRWINQYLVIPMFNLLKSTGLSMGIVILLLTLIVKLVISPLTYKSFMSSAKMRVLKPQVEELGAKYPKPEQAQEKQQAVMALYNKAGANPMSGCIPMLLQMPILIALFQFFPNAIELRHQSFLWAKDLSTYDAIYSLPDFIPFVGGTHLSLFCILMTITNIVYTKFNMDATNTGQQQMPGMKWMMYLMPLIFFFVLNDYPAGLTYYYFISLLMTILLTIGFRYAIDEKKVLAKLEANKAKPKKKSGFMARLEEAQRMQQQQVKSQNKNKKK